MIPYLVSTVHDHFKVKLYLTYIDLMYTKLNNQSVKIVKENIEEMEIISENTAVNIFRMNTNKNQLKVKLMVLITSDLLEIHLPHGRPKRTYKTT